MTDNPFEPPATLGAAELTTLGADRGARFVGAAIDSVVAGVPLAALWGAAVAARALDLDDAVALALTGPVFAAAAALCWIGPWVTISTRGQSYGKMLLGTRIVRANGDPVDFVRGVVLRSWVPTFGSVFLGSLAPIVDAAFVLRDDRRCLHDHIADTVVVVADLWDPYSR